MVCDVYHDVLRGSLSHPPIDDGQTEMGVHPNRSYHRCLVFYHEPAFRLQHLWQYLFQMGALFPVHADGSFVGSNRQARVEVQLRQRRSEAYRLYGGLLWDAHC